MKKVILAVIIGISMVSASFAKGIEGNVRALNNFKSEFGDIKNVQWEKFNSYSLATFTMGNENMRAYYNADGELFGTSKAITIDALPTGVKRAFSKKFGNYVVKEAIRFEGSDETAYFMVVENAEENLVLKVVDGSIIISKRVKK